MTNYHAGDDNLYCVNDIIDTHLKTEESFQNWIIIVRQEIAACGEKYCFSKLTSADSSLLREVFYMTKAVNFCMRHLRAAIHIQSCCSIDLLALYLICEQGEEFYFKIDYKAALMSYNKWCQQVDGEFKFVFYKMINTWSECKVNKDIKDETFYLPKDFYVLPAKFSFATVVGRLVRKNKFDSPWVHFKDEGVISAKYLNSARELKRHALAQKNCAYDYLGNILLGDCQFFEMKFGEKVLTLELQQDVKRRPSLHECLYAKNEIPEYFEMEKICLYLERHGVTTSLLHCFEERIRLKRSEVRWYADMIYGYQHDVSMRESLRWDDDDLVIAKRRLEVAGIELSLLQSGDFDLMDLLPLKHCKKT